MRLAAAHGYAAALAGAGEPAEAVRLQRGILDALTRAESGVGARGLQYAGLCLDTSQYRLCTSESTRRRRRSCGRRSPRGPARALGADAQDTLNTESHLALVLLNLGEYADAEALCRASLEKRRRVFGRVGRDTATTSGNLASSLLGQGKHAEAVEINRDVLISMTRLSGAEHQETLTSARNLADSLSGCGQKAEAEQLLRDTLARDVPARARSESRSDAASA